MLLVISLIGNLGMLCFFKYGGFLLDNFVLLTHSLGIDFHPAKPNIILPAGISFYTFTTLCYTIDMYKRESKPVKSFLDFSLFVTPGVNSGEKFADLSEEAYANRLVLAVDEASRSLIMFEPDLKAGDEVQLMRRSVDLHYIEKGIKNLTAIVKGSKPVFSFYINCAGRAKPYAGGEFEDAEEVQKALGSIPFMGFYSGVEVAQVKGKLQPLDWTGVLCMISE